MIICVLGFAGVLLYAFWTERSAEHQVKRSHDCAVAKVANPQCEEVEKSAGKEGMCTCPAYMVFDNPSAEEEASAMIAAERECREEMGLEDKSLHEQLKQYKKEHGIK